MHGIRQNRDSRKDAGKIKNSKALVPARGRKKKLPQTSNRWYQKFVGEEMYPVRPRL